MVLSESFYCYTDNYTTLDEGADAYVPRLAKTRKTAMTEPAMIPALGPPHTTPTPPLPPTS